MSINEPNTKLERIGWWFKWWLTYPVWSRVVCWRGHDWGEEGEPEAAFCSRCDKEHPGYRW